MPIASMAWMRLPAILLLLIPLTWAAFGASVQEPVSEPLRPEAGPEPTVDPLPLPKKTVVAEPPRAESEPPRRPPGPPRSGGPPPGLPPDPWVHPLTLPIEFGPGPDVRGRVVDEEGIPVRDFTVHTDYWRSSGRGCPKPRFRSGEGESLGGGRFVYRFDAEMIELMPEGRRAAPFRIVADGYLPTDVELTGEQFAHLIRGIDVEGLTVGLRRSAVIRGRVVGSDGRGISGIFVWRMESPGAKRARGEVRTNSTGGFEMRGVDPERKDFLVARDYRRSSNHLSLAGRLVGGETLEAEFLLNPPAEVTLTVVLNGFKKETEVALDRRQVKDPGPVTTIQTWHGAHELKVRFPGESPVSWIVEVPRDAHTHTVTIDLTE